MRSRFALYTLPVAVAMSFAGAASGKAYLAPKPKPSSQTSQFPPGKTPLPVPEKMKPTDVVVSKLNAKIARSLRKPNLLSKTEIAGIATRFKIPADPNDVRETTALTIRRAYASGGAWLTFPSTDGVRPEADPDGTASILGDGQLRRVRGTGPAITPSETYEDMNRQHDPLHPDFPADADVTINGGYLGIHLQAAANLDYVVSCRVSSESTSGLTITHERVYAARVERSGTYSHLIRGLRPERGRVSFAIPRAASKRRFDIQLVSYRQVTSEDAFGWGGLVQGTNTLIDFSASRCDITPIG